LSIIDVKQLKMFRIAMIVKFFSDNHHLAISFSLFQSDRKINIRNAWRCCYLVIENETA